MLERVVENWLTKVNERSMEIPFCQLLTSEGYQVIHLSRHGSFEQGKDIIAIAPDGVPCAFQLKGAPNGGKITQKAWAKDYLEQVIRLVEIPIKHPSIDSNLSRRVYFVTNGELDEEVRVEIADRNSEWERRGYPKLETTLKGQLLTRFLRLHTNLWPIELIFEKNLLELFLADGTDCLDKGKFAGFIGELLFLSDKQLNKSECSRILASAAIMTAYALTPYEVKSNHVATFEGWVIYAAYLAALVEKYDLNARYWQESFNISLTAIEYAFANLCDELRVRKHLVEGDPLVDQPFYRGRVTWLVGLVSTFVLWNTLRNQSLPDDLKTWSKSFVEEHQKDLLLWGEAAVSQFLAAFWFLSSVTANLYPVNLLTNLIKSISAMNAYDNKEQVGLPDPYHNLSKVIELRYDLSPNRLREENYLGQSYTIESLIHMLAKRSWRQRLRWLWPQITRVRFIEFYPDQSWEFCLWYCENGHRRDKQPEMPQSWTKLRDESRQVNLDKIPKIFQQYPELLLAFIIVYPHRLTTDVAKFLDDCL